MEARFPFALLVALIAATTSAKALIVPFTEDFSTGASNWLNGSSAAPTWSATGGVDGGASISAPGSISAGGFGTIVFRGNAAADASGDAFVGNWLTGGVSTFSAFVRHDAPVALNFYARLDAGSGRAASSVDFSVPVGGWFQLNIPIAEASFQSYGAAGTGTAAFNSVFSSMLNVQIALSSTQDPSTAGQTYNVSLDRVATVPEPSVVALCALALAGYAATHRRAFGKHRY
jgi:hypothetical protein